MRPFLRKISAADVAPFLALWHRNEASIGYALHFHQEYELTLILRSRGLRHVGDSIEAYEAGDLLLTAPSVPHSYESDPNVPASDHEQVVVHFQPRLFDAEALTHPSLQPLVQLLKQSTYGLCFSAPTRAQVLPIMSQMAATAPLRRLSQLLEVLQLLTEDTQRRTLSQQSFSTRGETLEPIDRVCQFLNQNFTQDISVARAASLAGMSPAAFSRAFSRATGRTLIVYLNEMRLRKACRLLLEGDRSVAEVATAAGFDNVGYFNRRFLAAIGVRPTEYRRNGPAGVPQQKAVATSAPP